MQKADDNQPFGATGREGNEGAIMWVPDDRPGRRDGGHVVKTGSGDLPRRPKVGRRPRCREHRDRFVEGRGRECEGVRSCDPCRRYCGCM